MFLSCDTRTAMEYNIIVFISHSCINVSVCMCGTFKAASNSITSWWLSTIVARAYVASNNEYDDRYIDGYYKQTSNKRKH